MIMYVFFFGWGWGNNVCCWLFIIRPTYVQIIVKSTLTFGLFVYIVFVLVFPCVFRIGGATLISILTMLHFLHLLFVLIWYCLLFLVEKKLELAIPDIYTTYICLSYKHSKMTIFCFNTVQYRHCIWWCATFTTFMLYLLILYTFWSSTLVSWYTNTPKLATN